VTASLLRIPTELDLAELVELLPPGTVLTDPDLCASYQYDKARDPSAEVPLAVVRPTETAQVQAVMRWAQAASVAVVPRGAGSGLSGGAGGLARGIVLSLERMRALSIDPGTRTATAQAGLLNGEIKQAAAAQGLWYPPDPSSFEIASIGGNVATNAGGLCCVKYGVTSDYVLGLEVVLADGTLVRLGGRLVKDVAGLSLAKLFVGSEGTLGIVTEVILRLLPAKPPASTAVAIFASMRQASEAVASIASTLRPSMLELMDHTSINAVEDMLAMDLDRTAGALLLAQSDAPGPAAALELAQIHQACLAAGALEAFTTDDPAEGEAFAVARRAALPALELKGDLFLEDVGVPISQLSTLVAGIEDIAARWDTVIGTVAHAGDGNTHPLVVFDRSDPDAKRRAEQAFGEIMALALSLGGTITGEHGVGRLKRDWLPRQLGPEVMALTQRIKDALDPIGILNPGTLLAAAGTPPA
jgi:glycolate oxidase